MFKLTIDLRVTSACDMCCNFCHGAPKGLEDSSIEIIEVVIKKLKEAGVGRIVISGGEPLMRQDTPEIILLAKSIGFDVYLSTNGYRFDRYHEFSHLIDWIGIPLDGSTTTVNLEMSRGVRLFTSTSSILSFFHTNKPAHGVKVGTVVSAINIADILNIGNLLFESSRLYPPDVWRLYDFVPRGKGFTSQHSHSVTPQQFTEVSQAAIARFGERVSPLSNEDHDNSYYFVNPDMSLVTACGNTFPYLCDLKTVSVKELSRLFETTKITKKKSRRNRQWINR
ncbi:MAG TPA: radical SAM protein [Candidatus Vogelbacteria bacterium]|nr:radical SAM protein [Candidatus Vogelbacteria bacterium]